MAMTNYIERCRDCRGTGADDDGEPCAMCFGGTTLPLCPTCGGTGAAPLQVPRTFFVSFLNEPDEWSYDDAPRDCEDCLGTGVHPEIPTKVATGDVPEHVELFLTRVADLLESSSPRMAQAIRQVAKERAA